MAERQRATAMYFIDKLALRAGNEKGEDEADTVGCCSLRCEHVTLENDKGEYYITFDFLGKDSIRYYNRVQVDQQIFKNVRIFKENKNDDDSLFDRVNVRFSLLCPARRALMPFSDQLFEQASHDGDEGPHRESLPYLQRVHHLPKVVGRGGALTQECYAPGEAQRVQRR